VNPWHLEEVTAKINVNRGTASTAVRRKFQAMTHCRKGHPYSPETLAQQMRACPLCRQERQHRLSRRILAAIELLGGATDIELMAQLKIAGHSTIAMARQRLVREGLVVASNRRRLTPSGSNVTIWELAPVKGAL
jgi:hypothetical protein